MMLTQRLSVLAHDLAKQCQVKSEEKSSVRSNSKKLIRNKTTESGEKGALMEDRKLSDFYKLGEAIGSGGSGKVYAGTCKKTGLSVAIKVIPKRKVVWWTEIGNRVVPKEVALLHNLQQKYIIKMLDYFDGTDVFYIVMERPQKFIDLFDYISQMGTVSERSARYLFRQVLEATQYCLSMGVVHRDVKDENILLDLVSYQVKLIDFGSGTFLQDDAYTEYEGTFVYSPPEWNSMKRYHAIPATVWSLGILLHDMLMGNVPFEKKSDIILAKLCFGDYISKDAESLIRWMLSVRPHERPSIEQVLNHPWLRDSSSTPSQGPFSSSSSSSSSTNPTSSSSYLKTLPYYSPQSPPMTTSLSPHQSYHNSSYSRGGSQTCTPMTPALHSPPAPSPQLRSHIQTRSQTRMAQCHGPPAMLREGHGKLCDRGRGGRGGRSVCKSSSEPANGNNWIDGVPRAPSAQVRKGQERSRVTRNK